MDGALERTVKSFYKAAMLKSVQPKMYSAVFFIESDPITRLVK